MGHGSSKPSVTDSSDDSTTEGSNRSSSLFSRLHIHRHHRRLHLHRGGSGSHSGSHSKLHAAEDFAGIALVKLIGAEMKFKDKWLACISFGEQTFRTAISDHTDKPIWNSFIILPTFSS
ncbi:hypothetical protein CsSME_00035771 [Camellia sinensis var. sinensis]